MARKGTMHPGELPFLLFADNEGIIYEHPYLRMVASNGETILVPRPKELIAMPSLSKLFYLPGCLPVGLNLDDSSIEIVEEVVLPDGTKIVPNAVSAFLEPGYVRSLLPSARPTKKRPLLPLWAYCAAGGLNGDFYVTAFQIEKNPKWDPRNYDDRFLPESIVKLKKRFPKNRLLYHLAQCATTNHCFAAKNLFFVRWEAPMPTSRACNAMCLGCLSCQRENKGIQSHQRIDFTPKVEEIVQLALHHIAHAQDPIVSFGQGCEGEPLTEYQLIVDAISRIREVTDKGTININTNGSWPERVKALSEAGLDSIRVSLNSPRPDLYNAYFRPKGFDIESVKESLKVAKAHGLFTMINYLIFPGITDQEEELEAMCKFIEETNVDFIHLKNLCIDPWIYLSKMPGQKTRGMGIRRFYEGLKSRYPHLLFGYFNRTRPMP